MPSCRLLFSMSEWPIEVILITVEFAPFACRYIPAICTKLILDTVGFGFLITVHPAMPQPMYPEVSGAATVPSPLS